MKPISTEVSTGKCCTNCNEFKSLESFYKNPKTRVGLRPECITCIIDRSSKVHNNAIDNYQCYIDGRGNCCDLCGVSYAREVYNLHHINSADKTNGRGLVAQRWTNSSLPRNIEEANKCALLCANCHILEHVALRAGRTLLTNTYANVTLPEKNICEAR